MAVLAHRKKYLHGAGLDALRETLAAAGVEDPLWYEVNKSRKAPKRARAALKEGADLVLVWGGDGMVQRSVDALAGSGVPVGLLPAGTANLLASNLGIPDNLEAAVKTALHGDRRTLDLGLLTAGDVEEHFAVMAGAGFDAELVGGADRRAKARLGKLAYFRSGLAGIRGPVVRARVKVDGTLWYEGPASCVLLGNVGRIVGGVPAFDDADPSDGLLEVGVTTASGVLQWARTLGRMTFGRSDHSQFIRITRGRKITVKLAKPLPIELDGGARDDARKLTATVAAGALIVCVPHP
ncbi:MAG TPA: diacylglycerol kinase family protein [Mycobacteriales bacterium]|nr:diacylglycerol kinase family protein [Mycobacteriales bacterium]